MTYFDKLKNNSLDVYFAPEINELSIKSQLNIKIVSTIQKLIYNRHTYVL